MVLWWTTLIAIFGSMGTILLSIVMLAHIGDETDPRAIFWFFVAAAATGVLYFAIKADNSTAMRSVSWRPTITAPVVQSAYWIVYHGTPTWNNASGAMREGFVPGKDGTYGIAVYTAFDFDLARSYASGVGYVFKLFIDQNTPIANYSQIPGETVEAKREHCLRNGWGLVYEEQFKMFLCFGYIGVPVAIPGLNRVEVLDLQGKPVHI